MSVRPRDAALVGLLACCWMVFGCAQVFSADESIEVVVVRVVDADTVRVRFPDYCPGMPAIMQEISVRFYGCDAPEKRSPNPELRALQREGMDLMKSLLRPGQRVQLQVRKWDKFGGRVDGVILVDGLDPCELLIGRGLAKPYHGESKSGLWQ